MTSGFMAAYEDTTIVLPTLNEEKSIAAILTILLSKYPGIRIIVVDDGSSDKTQSVVSSQKNNAVELIDRSKKRDKGLTASLVDGVLASKTPYVIAMDADLQHPPESVKEIVDLLRENNEVVVGCRRKIKKWGFHRRLISGTATLLAKTSLALNGSPKCSDVLSGFFGVKREVIQQACLANRQRFQSNGYKFLYDLLKCLPKETRVAEIRYDFGMRDTGKSKIGLKHILAFLASLLR